MSEFITRNFVEFPVEEREIIHSNATGYICEDEIFTVCEGRICTISSTSTTDDGREVNWTLVWRKGF